MQLFSSFIVGLFVTIVLIPPLVRVSAWAQLLDKPNDRKVHSELIPRVGGIAIAIGVLLPVVTWVTLDRTTVGYLVGAAIIIVFGVWDDRRQLNYKWKFLAQFAAIVVAMQGGVVLAHLPFFGLDPVPDWLSYPITILFLLGITNAINLFDGLDGLAGGCALLTLGAIAVLANEVDGTIVTLIALAAFGGILGFLRYNTHPAIVFMGDAGSQFLGFTSAVLAILLTEKTHTALNPALPLLLIGLPVLDTLTVLVMRIVKGRSPFVADKTHIHHKLLNLGFRHHEAVSVIYLIQGLMVASAFFLAYQSDVLVVFVFCAFCATVLGLSYCARVSGWRMHPLPSASKAPPEGAGVSRIGASPVLAGLTARFVEVAISAFFVLGALLAKTAPQEVAKLSIGVAVVMGFAVLFLRPWTQLFTRLGVYAVSVQIVYFLAPLTEESQTISWTINSYLILVAGILAIAILATPRDLFQVTPQDLLIAFVALAVPSLPVDTLAGYPIAGYALRVGLLFYACEYLLSKGDYRYRLLRVSAFASLLIIGLRGWLG